MPKTNKYFPRESKSGEFSGRLNKRNAERLRIYCEINNKNQTHFLNELVAEGLDKRFGVLKEGVEK